MIEQDTIRLLRECDAEIRMGVSSLGDVLGSVREVRLKARLQACRNEHQALETELENLLSTYHDNGKAPNVLAKSMSEMKTGMKLAMDKSDKTIADLMTDGCNMGVKSLSRYLNQYAAADETSKDLARRLIRLEEKLAVDLRPYL